MGQPVTIVINAETEAAAKSLSAFLTQTREGLRALEAQSIKLRAALNNGWGALPDVREFTSATRTAGEALTGFTRNAGNSRLAMMEMGHVARATAEGLAFGIPPSRLLAMEFPRIAQSATMLGVSLSTLGLGLIALLPLIITGGFAWSAYKAKQQEAASEEDLYAQTLFLQKRNLEALKEAYDKGVVSLQNYLYIRRLLDIGTPSAIESATKEMGLLGISHEQIEAFDKLRKLEVEMHTNTLEGAEQERAKAYQVYEARLQQIRELAKESIMAGAEQNEAELKAAAEYNAKLKHIDENEQKQKAAKALQDFDDNQVRQISIAEAGSEKRIGLTEKEYDARRVFLKDLLTKYPAAEAEITKALDQSIQERNSALRSEAEQRQRLIEIQKLQRDLERQAAQDLLREQLQNPYLSNPQRLGLLNQAGGQVAGQLAQNLTASIGADPERQLQLQRERNQLQQQYVGILRQQQAIQSQASFRDQWAGAVQKLKELNNLASESAQAFQNVFNTAISSISDNITGLIEGTETWGQALRNIGTAILHEIISAIVTMAVRWIATSIMMAIFGTALVESTAAAYSAAWTGPAILSAIASYGGAAAAAPGEVMAALAFAPGISALAVGAREHGGPVKAGMPYIVGERRPELFVPDQNGTILPSVPRVSSRAAAGNGGRETKLSVNFFFDKNELFNHVRNHPDFEHVTMDAVRRNAHHLPQSY